MSASSMDTSADAKPEIKSAVSEIKDRTMVKSKRRVKPADQLTIATRYGKDALALVGACQSKFGQELVKSLNPTQLLHFSEKTVAAQSAQEMLVTIFAARKLLCERTLHEGKGLRGPLVCKQICRDAKVVSQKGPMMLTYTGRDRASVGQTLLSESPLFYVANADTDASTEMEMFTVFVMLFISEVEKTFKVSAAISSSATLAESAKQFDAVNGAMEMFFKKNDMVLKSNRETDIVPFKQDLISKMMHASQYIPKLYFSHQEPSDAKKKTGAELRAQLREQKSQASADEFDPFPLVKVIPKNIKAVATSMDTTSLNESKKTLTETDKIWSQIKLGFLIPSSGQRCKRIALWLEQHGVNTKTAPVADTAESSQDSNRKRFLLYRLIVNAAKVALLYHSTVILSTSLKMHGVALYGMASSLNHSCVPNCNIWYREDGKMRLTATRTINPGEELTISYDEDLIERSDLQNKYVASLNDLDPETPVRKFDCVCDQCKFTDFSDEKTREFRKNHLHDLVQFESVCLDVEERETGINRFMERPETYAVAIDEICGLLDLLKQHSSPDASIDAIASRLSELKVTMGAEEKKATETKAKPVSMDETADETTTASSMSLESKSQDSPVQETVYTDAEKLKFEADELNKQIVCKNVYIRFRQYYLRKLAILTIELLINLEHERTKPAEAVVESAAETKAKLDDPGTLTDVIGVVDGKEQVIMQLAEGKIEDSSHNLLTPYRAQRVFEYLTGGHDRAFTSTTGVLVRNSTVCLAINLLLRAWDNDYLDRKYLNQSAYIRDIRQTIYGISLAEAGNVAFEKEFVLLQPYLNTFGYLVATNRRPLIISMLTDWVAKQSLRSSAKNVILLTPKEIARL